jgi:poly(A) polymerase
MEEHPQARFIVDTLTKAGFIAYYAGGWVRDLLLKHPSDDIDIATNAPPETVQALFPHTVPVGIAFGIILVIIEEHPFEVATFRQDLDYKDGRRPSRIEFTTAIEDAKRRDFTINGMFYDPIREEVLDYVNGKADLKAKIIRAIGDPHERIREDRLRMIRAIRLACRFGFYIEEKTDLAIRAHANELFPSVAIERIWQELTKGHDFGKLHPMLIMLHSYGLLGAIFPSLKELPLAEIEHRLAPIQNYPAEAPVIAFLLPLFTSDHFDLCERLKLSKIDVQFVAFLHHAKQLVQLDVEAYEWAQFYANPFALISLQIISAHLDEEKRLPFLHAHEGKREKLQSAIARIEQKDPVINASFLIQAGIQPGVLMGKLLKEAERIAINENLDEANEVLQRLKKHPLWPK